MNRISRISGHTPITPVNPVKPRAEQSIERGISFKEKFDFREIENEISGGGYATLIENCDIAKVLTRLFSKIGGHGIMIIPQPRLKANDYIIEASFSQSRQADLPHQLRLPINGIKEPLKLALSCTTTELKTSVTDYVTGLLNYNSTAQLLKLVILASHEYGHYLSYLQGNHDKALQQGIYTMHSQQFNNKSDEVTWLVFREESTAWYLAKQVLTNCGFDLWDIFERIKNTSLKAYFTSLRLAEARISIYTKLAMLGEDFCVNSSSQMFNSATK